MPPDNLTERQNTYSYVVALNSGSCDPGTEYTSFYGWVIRLVTVPRLTPY